jgi:hypothetical protein
VILSGAGGLIRLIMCDYQADILLVQKNSIATKATTAIRPMTDYKDLLSQLASNPKTSPGLLRELCSEDTDLLPLIAKNPNCSQELLNKLSLSNPKDVLINPVLHLAEKYEGNGYRLLSLRSLVSLCMACDSDQHAALLNETMSRIAEGIAELQEQDQASLSCNWLYERAFTLYPAQCNNIINEPIDIEIKAKAKMYGSGPISFTSLPEISEDTGISLVGTRQDLQIFLSAISTGSLTSYIAFEFSLEDTGDAELDVKADDLPQGLMLWDETLYKMSTPCEEGINELEEDGEFEEAILEFEHTYWSDPGPVILRDEFYLVVPVVYVDEANHVYDLRMGELGDLLGLKVTCSRSGCDLDWPSRIAELLLPS